MPGSMEWEPAQDLGGLDFAGICRETYRVGIRASLNNKKGVLGAAILSALVLVHDATFWAGISRLYDVVVSHLDAGESSDIVSLVDGFGLWILLEIIFVCVLAMLSFRCTADFVFCTASIYCPDGKPGATDRIVRDLPRAPLERLLLMFSFVFPVAIWYIVVAVVPTLLVLFDLLVFVDDDAIAIVQTLEVLGSMVCLLIASPIAVLSHLSCVVVVLGDAVLCGAVRKSRALLAGKFLEAWILFVLLDHFFILLQMSFIDLVFDNFSLGLSLWFQVAAGAAIAVALWAVVVVRLVAQPVVYLVCKNHHHQVLDKVHLVKTTHID